MDNASTRISGINEAPCIDSSKFLSQPSKNLSKDFEKGPKISDINTSSPDGDKFNESGSSSVENPSYRQTKRLKTKPYPIELKKTGAALLFMVLNFCATTISLALTHERIPDKAPLPDFLLDNIQTRSWGLTASEIVLQVSQ